MKPRYYECGICDQIHPWDWDGDCRDDANRLTLEVLDAEHGSWDAWELFTWEERLRADFDNRMNDLFRRTDEDPATT